MQQFTETIRISKNRKNGLRLRAIEMGTFYDNVTLDLILSSAGVSELSDNELKKLLKKKEEKK